MTNSVSSPPHDSISQLFSLSIDMLGTVNDAGYFTLLNPAWERTLGWSSDELMAEPYISFIHPDDVAETLRLAAIPVTPDSRPVINFVNRYRTRDGDFRWIEWTAVVADGVSYFVAKEISERKEAEHRRDEAASLRQAIVDNVADGLCVVDASGAISLMNPAGLRMLNYDSEDELLGLRPHTAFHHTRLDGTHYPIGDCPISRVAVDGKSVHVSEDTFWRKDGTALPVSFSSAPIDTGDGLGSVIAFHDITAMQVERARVLAEFGDVAWFEEIRVALARDRFVMYEQPIVDVATRETVKHELLIRMLSLSGEVIGPDKFLPAAEKHGLIQDIDRWVFTQAAELAAVGRQVTVNLSAASIGSTAMLLHIEREMERTRAIPECLTFEVTETSVMKDLHEGRRFADRLVELGCSFALDDFGTGYGSLTYLRQLPIAYLKIDVQFVRDMVTNVDDRKLVETVVSIAKSLGKKTIAEGVEDERTFGLLAELGIDYGQGYHLGRPAPLAAHPRALAD